MLINFARKFQKIVKIWDDGKISNSNIEFLKLKTKKVTFPLSPFINQIIQDLIDTYKATSCAGIAANQIGYDKKILLNASLIGENNDGKSYDKFKERSIFPIYFRNNT